MLGMLLKSEGISVENDNFECDIDDKINKIIKNLENRLYNNKNKINILSNKNNPYYLKKSSMIDLHTKTEKELEELKEKPTINKNSINIFYKNNKKYVPIEDRVDNILFKKEQKRNNLIINKDVEEYSYTPKINKKDVKNHLNIEKNIDVIISNKNKRLEDAKLYYKMEELKNYSFRPKINNYPNLKFKGDVVERLYKKKEEYIENNIKKKNIKNYNFKPKINKNIKRSFLKSGTVIDNNINIENYKPSIQYLLNK